MNPALQLHILTAIFNYTFKAIISCIKVSVSSMIIIFDIALLPL